MRPDSKENFTTGELSRMINEVGPGIAKAAINALKEEASLKFEISPTGYTITSNGIRKAELIRQEELAKQKPKNLGEKKSTFKEFKDSLLIELAKADQSAGGEYFDLKTLAENAGLSYQEGWVRKAGNSFKDYGLINDAFSLGGGADGNMDASLSAEGLELAEELMENRVFLVKEEPSIPASDRVVKLSDNEYNEASQALTQIIEEFREDHNFGNEWAAEKSVLLKALEAGQEYLEVKAINVRIGTMMIIEPLKNIADKYKDPAINGTFSALVQKALDFFINLFAG